MYGKTLNVSWEIPIRRPKPGVFGIAPHSKIHFNHMEVQASALAATNFDCEFFAT
jgi:hypothetical protein